MRNIANNFKTMEVPFRNKLDVERWKKELKAKLKTSAFTIDNRELMLIVIPSAPIKPYQPLAKELSLTRA